ncbi:MAG: fasciclin domain-containing protein [Bacteroidota bacterium]
MTKLNWLYAFAFVLVGSLAFTACNNDDEEVMEEPDPEPQSIVDIVAGDDNFSDLAAALTRVNLIGVLEGAGPFTVFAPDNDAFAASGIDVDAASDEELTNILLYHVLGANIKSTDLTDNAQTYASTDSEAGPEKALVSLLVERAGNSVTLNGTINVKDADIEAENGVIHVIDNVLQPVDIVGAAIANSQFTTLVGALQDADGDLVAELQKEGPVTVFAPLNSAFADIEDTVAGLDASQLASVLTYHVTNGNVVSSGLSNGQVVETLQGEEFTINIDGETVTITDANDNTSTVVLTDVQTTNGVIHVLNAVIIPVNL